MNLKLKHFFALVSFLPLITSCSQNEDFGSAIEAQSSEISFANAFIDNNQRSVGEIVNTTIAQNGNTFGVWGYKTVAGVNTSVFEGTTVTSNGTKWDYTNHRYWDVQASYDFIATMPNDLTTNAQVNGMGGTVTWENIPLSAPVKTGIDYLVSNKVAVGNQPNEKTVVKFTFQHILSQLNVFAAATYSGTTAKKVEILSMDLHLPSGKATYKQANHDGPTISQPLSGTVNDAWTWEPGFDYQKTPVQTEPIEVFNSKLYRKLANSFFVAPTPTNTATTYDAANGVNLRMDISFRVTYNDAGEEKTETFAYNDLKVADLHTFTQGYITNLYVNINLDEIQFSVDKVISFSDATVTDWTDSDDNYIDELGYSFNFKFLEDFKSIPAEGTVGFQKIADIDSYGNSGIFYTTNGRVYSNPECTHTVGEGAGTHYTSMISESGVKVRIAPNLTQEIRTYYVQVRSIQLGDTRVISFTQEPTIPILRIDKEELAEGNAKIWTPNVPLKINALLDATHHVRVTVTNTTTKEEVQLTSAFGTGTSTVGHDGTISSILSNLSNGNTFSFTPKAGNCYTIEVSCSEHTNLFKKYYLYYNGLMNVISTTPF